MKSPVAQGDHGGSVVEYAAVIALVAAIAVAAVTSGFGREIAENISTALDCLDQRDDCEPGGTPVSDGGDPNTPTAPDAAPVPGQDSDSPEPSECWDWIQSACEFGQGMWLEGQDMVLGAIEGAQQTGCLLHICNPDDFDETWRSTGDQIAQVFTDPWGAMQDSWDAATAEIRGDYNAGYEERSVGRVALIAGSTVFGFLGLSVRALPDADLPVGSVRTHLGAAQREARNGNVAGAERAAENAQRLADASAERAEKDPTPDNQEQARQDQKDANQARLDAQSAEGFEILSRTKSGRELNGLLHRYGTEITFTDDPNLINTVMYNPGTDTITMGSNFLDGDPVVVATRLAHEATHARQNHSNENKSPYHYNKNDYVNYSLQMEAEGELAEITVRNELRADGADIPVTREEEIYTNSYDSYMSEAEGTGMSTKRAEEMAEMVATQELADHIGRQTNSITNEPYRDYYENYWDEANPDGE